MRREAEACEVSSVNIPAELYRAFAVVVKMPLL